LANSSLATGFDALSGYVEQIDTKAIRDTRRPLRRDLGPLEELMASIMERGLLEPIVVRPDRDSFEVVAGSRRLEACRRLKIRKVPCHVVELCDRGAYEVSLTENIQRRTLNPIEEGEAFKKYVGDYGYGGIAELARRIGKSHSYVSRRISLLDLPDRLKEDVVRRRTSPSAASELFSLDEESRVELVRMMDEMEITSRNDIRKLARRRKRKDTEASSYYTVKAMNAHQIDRTLGKCIASVKEDMAKFDQAMSSLDDEDEESWVIKESLMWHRRFMNSHLDYLLGLRRKFRHTYNL
jgi:ParB family chromosome partitioning protein